MGLRPFYQALATQALIVVGAGALVYDMGETQRLCAIASIPFWLAVAMIGYRRPTLTKGDQVFVRWSLLPIVLVTAPLVVLARDWFVRLRGY
jgi:hypothetical protein